MNSGSCLCGSINYQIIGQPGDIVHCHCQTCQKAHGAAFSSVAAVKEQNFKLFGQEALNNHESSPGKFRYFCSHCGTQIYAKREGSEDIILRLGSLDTQPDSKESHHIWVSQKASWYSIQNQLPENQEY
ncbi:GFA family protein [Agaribacterium sp. ZY112]|uniref:GFA family protein n=1 Tax=Agaribacterium sp. ZY112 TaxID=3233574 RepID=UPI003524CEBF